jgi:hypothetical protein
VLWRVAEIVDEISSSEYAIDHRLSRLRWKPSRQQSVEISIFLDAMINRIEKGGPNNGAFFCFAKFIADTLSKDVLFTLANSRLATLQERQKLDPSCAVGSIRPILLPYPSGSTISDQDFVFLLTKIHGFPAFQGLAGLLKRDPVQSLRVLKKVIEEEKTQIQKQPDLQLFFFEAGLLIRNFSGDRDILRQLADLGVDVEKLNASKQSNIGSSVVTNKPGPIPYIAERLNRSIQNLSPESLSRGIEELEGLSILADILFDGWLVGLGGQTTGAYPDVALFLVALNMRVGRTAQGEAIALSLADRGYLYAVLLLA